MPPRRKAGARAKDAIRKLARPSRPTKAKQRQPKKQTTRRKSTVAKAIKGTRTPTPRNASVPIVPPVLPFPFNAGRGFRNSYVGEIRVPKFAWDDLVGIDQIKEDILDEVVLPFAHVQKAALLNDKPPRGLLLTGPPGTGKTSLADAIVSEIRRLGRPDVNYFQESGSCVSSLVGETEEKLRSLFKVAHDRGPSIIFMDEIDGLARKRSGSSHSDSHASTMSTLLTLIGNIERGRVLLIAATNCPDLVDPAVVRKGRFDKSIAIPIPDMAGRQSILRYHFEKLDHYLEGQDYATLAEVTEGKTGSDLEVLIASIHRKIITRVFPNRGWVTMEQDKILKMKRKLQQVDMLLDVMPVLETNIANFNKEAFEDCVRNGGED